jgi:hypothetical protein
MSNGLCDNPVMKTEIKFMPAVEFAVPVQAQMPNDLPTPQNLNRSNAAISSTLQFQEIPIGQHFEFRGRRYRKWPSTWPAMRTGTGPFLWPKPKCCLTYFFKLPNQPTA